MTPTEEQREALRWAIQCAFEAGPPRKGEPAPSPEELAERHGAAPDDPSVLEVAKALARLVQERDGGRAATEAEASVIAREVEARFCSWAADALDLRNEAKRAGWPEDLTARCEADVRRYYESSEAFSLERDCFVDDRPNADLREADLYYACRSKDRDGSFWDVGGMLFAKESALACCFYVPLRREDLRAA